MIKTVVTGRGETAGIPYLKKDSTQILTAATSADATINPLTEAVLIQSFITAHFRLTLTPGTDPATLNDPVVFSGDSVLVAVPKGMFLSVVKHTGEPDGLVYVTSLEEV